MPNELSGLHHVTAIASDAQRNVDFYAGILGLRLLKRTVNFDDPSVYHLYYGDSQGAPGTILTFFIWPDAYRGRLGSGQFASVGLAVPAASLGFWIARFVAKGVPHEHPQRRFGELGVSFKDPDGLALELVAARSAGDLPGSTMGDVPSEHAIRRVHSAALWEDDATQTATFFTERLGFRLDREEGNRRRLAIGEADATAFVDLVTAAGFWEGSVAVGTIHHVAWRAPGDASPATWRDDLEGRGVTVSPVRDRQYYQSVYLNEPGGAILEIASDGPGFVVDEAHEPSETPLSLPPWLEHNRPQLEQSLPPLHLPPSPRSTFDATAEE